MPQVMTASSEISLCEDTLNGKKLNKTLCPAEVELAEIFVESSEDGHTRRYMSNTPQGPVLYLKKCPFSMGLTWIVICSLFSCFFQGIQSVRWVCIVLRIVHAPTCYFKNTEVFQRHNVMSCLLSHKLFGLTMKSFESIFPRHTLGDGDVLNSFSTSLAMFNFPIARDSFVMVCTCQT